MEKSGKQSSSNSEERVYREQLIVQTEVKIKVGEFILKLRRIIQISGAPASLLVLSGVCIAFSSLFQIVGLGLVVPVINGLVDQTHFEGIRHAAYIGKLLTSLPFEKNNHNIFIFMMLLIVLSVYLENMLLYFGRVFAAGASLDLVFRLREKLFSRFLGFGKSFYDRQEKGELNTLLTDVVRKVGELQQSAALLLIALCFSGAFLFMMLVISWRLTFFAAVLLPVTHYLSTLISGKIRVSAETELDNLVDLSDRSLDVLSNMQLTQLSGCERSELSRIRELSGNIKKFGLRVQKRRYLVPAVVDVLNSTGVVIVVCLGVFLFFSPESYSLGRLLVFFVALRRFTSHLVQVSGYWAQFAAGIPSLDRVLWGFEDGDKAILKSGTVPFPGLKEKIEFCAVDFSYESDQPVLQGISFEVRAGQMAAIIGPTGAGKTTIINLLPRFYDPTAGAVKIDETDIKDFDISSLRQKIAVVSQDAMIMNDTIRGNILYGVDPRYLNEGQYEEALQASQLHDFIRSLPERDKTRVGSRGVRLSGGEKQRISIARAVLKNPDILILDEATSALDSETEIKIQQAIEYIAHQRTTLVVAHRLSTIRRADLVLVLDKGQIVERGSPANLLKSAGEFQKYWKMQNLTA